MGKRIFGCLFLLNLFFSAAYSQNIDNSADVKFNTPLKLDWSYKSGNLILNQKLTDNICYLNTGDGIKAVSLADGRELWHYDYPSNSILCSIVTFSGTHGAFITYEFIANEDKAVSKLYLIDLTTGKELWTNTFEKNWYEPAPLLDSNNVYVLGGPPNDWEKPEKYFKMELDDAYLYAYSLKDGKEIWKTGIKDSKSELLNVIDDKVFLTYDLDFQKVTPYNRLLCYDAKTGNKLWDYNPSGMITKSSIGEIVQHENKLYVRPIKGSMGEIAGLDPASGDEIWSHDNGADNIIFHNNKSYAFSANASIGSGISFTSWYCTNLADGKKVFHTEIKTTKEFGEIFKSIFFSIGVMGMLYKLSDEISRFGQLFGIGENTVAPLRIPTSSSFSGLLNKAVVNDKGLFGIYYDGTQQCLNLLKDNPDDDFKDIYKFPEGANGAFIANGTSATNVFVTYNAKICAVNIETGKEEWSQDCSLGANDFSLGLIISGNKIYLYTGTAIFQFSSGDRAASAIPNSAEQKASIPLNLKDNVKVDDGKKNILPEIKANPVVSNNKPDTVKQNVPGKDVNLKTEEKKEDKPSVKNIISSLIQKQKNGTRDSILTTEIKLQDDTINIMPPGNTDTIKLKNNSKPLTDTSKVVVRDISKNSKTREQVLNTKDVYQALKETNPKEMFFTDGKLYCFQLSSWKIKAQADKEVTRLKSLGYSALVQEASIPKMGKWYRVRIGYFNSLQEAADYKKKMKK